MEIQEARQGRERDVNWQRLPGAHMENHSFEGGDYPKPNGGKITCRRGGVTVTGLPQQEASHVVTAELSNQTSAGKDVEMLPRPPKT